MMNLYRFIKRAIRQKRDKVYNLFRLKEINYLAETLPKNLSIFSMNCFGGKIYQDPGHEYTSPTAGLFFTAADFNRIVANISVLKRNVIFTQHADN